MPELKRFSAALNEGIPQMHMSIAEHRPRAPSAQSAAVRTSVDAFDSLTNRLTIDELIAPSQAALHVTATGSSCLASEHLVNGAAPKGLCCGQVPMCV